MRLPTRYSGSIVHFTLVELLVVVAIIAVLASILLPSLSEARQKARRVACTGNEKQVGMGFQMYGGDFDDWLPPSYGATTIGGVTGNFGWHGFLGSYLGLQVKNVNPTLFICPVQPLTVGATSNNAGHLMYSANQILFGGVAPSYNGPTVSPMLPVKLTQVNKPAVVLVIADGTQVAAYGGSSASSLIRFPFSRNDQPSNWTGASSYSSQAHFDGEEGYISYRHDGLGASILLADGHADFLRLGDLLYDNVFPSR